MTTVADSDLGAAGVAEAQNCVAMGQQLQNGACASMNQQLTQNANQILGAPCSALAQRVQRQQPSAECAPCLSTGPAGPQSPVRVSCFACHSPAAQWQQGHSEV